MRTWQVPEKEKLEAGLPRISDRAVRVSQEKGEAYYKRPASAPRHPDASYSIPDDQNPCGRIDVILLVGSLVAALCAVAYFFQFVGG
jgi:hypothetical protein